MVHVIAFTGLPGAGKSEAVEVARGRGVPVVRMGDFVFDETRRRGLPLEDRHVGRVADEMRRTQGMDYWARRTCDAILRDHAVAPLVVVDGARNEEEVVAFRSRLGSDFELVAVLAGDRLRQDRLQRRGRPDDAASDEAFRNRDDRERGWGIDRIIEGADHKLVNEGNLDAFRRLVAQLLDRLTASTG